MYVFILFFINIYNIWKNLIIIFPKNSFDFINNFICWIYF